MKQKILFVYNWVCDEQRKGRLGECASTETVNAIIEALISFDMEVVPLNLFNPEQMISVIQEQMPLDVAFVIAEGFLDEPTSLFDGSGALRVREVLEMWGIPYTHSGVEGMEACRNKDLTYEHLGLKQINIPKFAVFSTPEDQDNIAYAEHVVGYPMFIKPCGGGCSIGIDEKSIVNDRTQLIEKLNQVAILTPGQPVMAETYLCGREYTVGVIGNELPSIMPIVAFPEDFSVRSQGVKKVEYQERARFEILSPGDLIGLKIREMAIKVFDALSVRDIIRIDMKEDSHGNIYVIDVNGTPSLALKGSLSFTMENIGLTHGELVVYLLYITMIRYGLLVNDILNDMAFKVITMLEGGTGNQVA